MNATLGQLRPDTNHNLSLHGEEEEDYEIEDQNRPEDWHVEYFEEGAENGKNTCLHRRMPQPCGN